MGECPDAFGWGNSTTQLIEVKVSRSDSLSDKKKLWRRKLSYGLGRYRSYLCPMDLIKPKELPKYWGLLYYSEDGGIIKIIESRKQESNHIEEINLIDSILRREGIRPKMFSYKKYKDDLGNKIENDEKENTTNNKIH